MGVDKKLNTCLFSFSSLDTYNQVLQNPNKSVTYLEI